MSFANSSALISANKGEVASSVAVDVEKTNIFAFVMNFIERSLISNIGSSKSTIKKYAIGFRAAMRPPGSLRQGHMATTLCCTYLAGVTPRSSAKRLAMSRDHLSNASFAYDQAWNEFM